MFESAKTTIIRFLWQKKLFGWLMVSEQDSGFYLFDYSISEILLNLLSLFSDIVRSKWFFVFDNFYSCKNYSIGKYTARHMSTSSLGLYWYLLSWSVNWVVSDLSSLLVMRRDLIGRFVSCEGGRGTMGIMTADTLLCDNNDIIVPSSLFSCQLTTLCYACQTFSNLGSYSWLI